MADRQFRLAQKSLQETIDQDPSLPEPRYLLAESYFRMGQLDAAERLFGELVDDFPTHYIARQRSWAVQLARDPKNKLIHRKIETDINQLLSIDGNGIEQRYAAYQGYKYLRNSKLRVQILQNLVLLVDDHAMSTAIAALLLEEILAQRDKALRINLALLYLKYFPAGPGLDIATSWLVSTLNSRISNNRQFEQETLQLLEDYPGNRYLYQQIAMNLVQRNHHLERAIELLLEHEQIWKSDARIDHLSEYEHAHDYDPFWYEYSRTLLSLGIAYLRVDQLTKAKARLSQIRRQDPVYSRANHHLALIEERLGNNDGAIDLYRTALEAGTAYADTEALLATLVEKKSGEKQVPQRYLYPDASILFTDVTRQAGLDKIKAHRVAWGDFDNDGFDDLAIDGARLYRNQGDGSFKHASEAMGLSGYKGYSGGIWGDADNDGWLDLFLSHKRKNRLLRNIQGKRFEDITRVAFKHNVSGPTEAAAWGDVNNDGWLDLFTANYEIGAVERGWCAPDHLYLNQGSGRFLDVTISAGIRSDEPMCGRGVHWLDHNADGHQDILVANYRLDPNQFWIGDGTGKFEEKAAVYGVRGNNVAGAFGHSIGAVSGDIDNDYDIDLFISNLAHPRYMKFSDPSMVLMNRGNPDFMFNNELKNSGIKFEETVSDPLLFDADNDGDLDLFFTSIYRGRQSFLYRNDGKGNFSDVSWQSGARVANGWGVAGADYDLDGDTDILVASGDGLRLLRNEGSGNNWLSVRHQLPACNRFGVGNRVTLTYAGRKQVRYVSAGKGTGTQNSLKLPFGLGQYEGPLTVESIDLCGGRNVLELYSGNREITIQ